MGSLGSLSKRTLSAFLVLGGCHWVAEHVLLTYPCVFYALHNTRLIHTDVRDLVSRHQRDSLTRVCRTCLNIVGGIFTNIKVNIEYN